MPKGNSCVIVFVLLIIFVIVIYVLSMSDKNDSGDESEDFMELIGGGGGHRGGGGGHRGGGGGHHGGGGGRRWGRHHRGWGNWWPQYPIYDYGYSCADGAEINYQRCIVLQSQKYCNNRRLLDLSSCNYYY